MASKRGYALDKKLNDLLKSTVQSPVRPLDPTILRLTVRAMSMRASGSPDDEIARSERVDVQLLSKWMENPQQLLSLEESQELVRSVGVPAANERLVGLALSGDRKATMALARSHGGVLNRRGDVPAEQIKTGVIVGSGQGPIGEDPAC